MSTYRRSRKLQRGAAALEFAIVVPVLILLVFGIVDFGNVIGAQSTVASAAREGARAAALGANTTDLKKAANAVLASQPGANTFTITCTTPGGSSCSLDDALTDSLGTVRVEISHVHTWLAPTVIGMGNTITLVQSSTMRIE